MTVVSCGENEWMWDTPPAMSASIVGTWEAGYGYDMESYEFYNDFTGYYYFYSGWDLYYIYFEWRSSGNRIQIWYEDNFYEVLYYGFKDYGYLMLSNSPYFDYYTVYRSVNYFYDKEKNIGNEQVKGMDREHAKSFDTTTGERPRVATMKDME